MDKIQILADHYPLRDLLEQNDVEDYAVVKWLVDEGLVDLNDYFYDEHNLIVGDDD